MWLGGINNSQNAEGKANQKIKSVEDAPVINNQGDNGEDGDKYEKVWLWIKNK